MPHTWLNFPLYKPEINIALLGKKPSGSTLYDVTYNGTNFISLKTGNRMSIGQWQVHTLVDLAWISVADQVPRGGSRVALKFGDSAKHPIYDGSWNFDDPHVKYFLRKVTHWAKI